MRTTINIDDDLLARAAKAAGPLDRTAIVSEALKALIERESARRLARLGGSQPTLTAAPRRRRGSPVRSWSTPRFGSIPFAVAMRSSWPFWSERANVVMHPFVVGEKARGSLRARSSILQLLQDLPAAVVAEGDEVLGFIERHVLRGRGIGHVDIHLLASVALTEGASLWRRDDRLRAVASELGCAPQDAPAH